MRSGQRFNRAPAHASALIAIVARALSRTRSTPAILANRYCYGLADAEFKSQIRQDV